MSKTLAEMTLEELWQLFPIQLSEHNEKWITDYNEMKLFLRTILKDCNPLRIHHIGSTAIHNIWAKPIIDILIEIDESEDMNKRAVLLEQNGFTCMRTEKSRISLNRGYTQDGFAEKVYHIHLRYTGDNDELYFRDYLNEFPDVAASYEQLKLDLWRKFEHDRDGYTMAKTEFIDRYTEAAKEKYINRY